MTNMVDTSSTSTHTSARVAVQVPTLLHLTVHEVSGCLDAKIGTDGCKSMHFAAKYRTLYWMNCQVLFHAMIPVYRYCTCTRAYILISYKSY